VSAGIPCPSCQHEYTRVTDSRPSSEPQAAIRRRRKCLKCGDGFTTYESYEPLPQRRVRQVRARAEKAIAGLSNILVELHRIEDEAK
jgi:transcriptional regulator NrdR family protein